MIAQAMRAILSTFPGDVVVKQPPQLAIQSGSIEMREDHAKCEVAQRAAERAGGLAATVATTLAHDLLDTVSPQAFVSRERRIDAAGIAQATCEGDPIFDSHRGALPRRGRRGVRGVADDDHPITVPGG